MVRKVTKIEPLKSKLFSRKKVAAYARVSSSKDAMLHSLAAQVSYYSELIQKHKDWEYVGVYSDKAITGTKDAREEFQRMMSDCRNGKIDMIITKSISRFARNTVTMLKSVRELKNMNINVYFEKENINSMSGDGEFILTILASFAQAESLSVSENCKWRIRKNFKEGIPNTFEVYGYIVKKGEMIIIPKEADIIRIIFDEFVNGNGYLAIAKKLNSLGFKTRNNKEWDGPKIKEILRNEKYVGDVLLQKKYIKDHLEKKTLKNDGALPQFYVTNHHKAIIDRDTFQMVQDEMNVRRKKYMTETTTVNEYPFTSMIKCGQCGSFYQRKLNNAGTKYQKAVWICSTYNRFGKEKCKARQVPEEVLLLKSAEVLKQKDFKEKIFKSNIREIVIPENNSLVFVFLEGNSKLLNWQYKSKSESWSQEARQKVSEANKKRRSEQFEFSKTSGKNDSGKS